MSSSPLPPSVPRKPFSLAKLATIFAVAGVLAFGLCTAGAMNAGNIANTDKFIGPIIGVSLVVEGLCLVGLLVVGVIAIVRSIHS